MAVKGISSRARLCTDVKLSLSRFIVHDTSEARRPRAGWLTGHWLQSRPPAFLALPSMTVDELHRLVLSFAAVLQAQRALCCAFHQFRMHLTLDNQ